MKKYFLAAALFMTTASLQAHGEGAFAVAVPEGGFKEGFAYGLATNYRTREIASDEALSECRVQAREYGVPPDRCRVVYSFRKQCVSVAFDRVANYVGWALGNDRSRAVASGLAKCGEGGSKCETAGGDCDE